MPLIQYTDSRRVVPYGDGAFAIIQSDTPRTDAAGMCHMFGENYTPTELSRTLERELIAANCAAISNAAAAETAEMRVAELEAQSAKQAATIRDLNEDRNRALAEVESLRRRLSDSVSSVALWNANNRCAELRRERDQAREELRTTYHNDTARAIAERNEALRACVQLAREAEGYRQANAELVRQRDIARDFRGALAQQRDEAVASMDELRADVEALREAAASSAENARIADLWAERCRQSNTAKNGLRKKLKAAYRELAHLKRPRTVSASPKYVRRWERVGGFLGGRSRFIGLDSAGALWIELEGGNRMAATGYCVAACERYVREGAWHELGAGS